jgi:hypothetical protein
MVDHLHSMYKALGFFLNTIHTATMLSKNSKCYLNSTLMVNCTALLCQSLFLSISLSLSLSHTHTQSED